MNRLKLSADTIRRAISRLLIGALLLNNAGSLLAAHGSEGLSGSESAAAQSHPSEHQGPGSKLEADECCLSACCPGATVTPGFLAAVDFPSSCNFLPADIPRAASEQKFFSSNRPSLYRPRAPPLI